MKSAVSILLGASIAAVAQGGPVLFDFENSFAISSVSTWGSTASLERAGANSRLVLTPAAGTGWKGVTLTLPARDLSAHLGVIMTLTNSTAKGFAVFCHIDDSDHSYPSNQGYVWLDAGATDTLYVHFHRKNPPAYIGTYLKGMRGLPGGFTDHWEFINTSKVDQIKLSMFSPDAGRTFSVDDIRAWGALSLPTEAELKSGFFPLIDSLGQYRHAAWPGKSATTRDLEALAAAEAADLAAHAGPGDWNPYGGWTGGPALQATGRFRAEKVQDKWWLVTPDGRLFWSHGINCVGTWETTPTAGRANYFTFIPPSDNFRGSNLKRKFGADYNAKANAQAHARLRSWGFNTMGNWSDKNIYGQKKTVYTVNFSTGTPQAMPAALDTAPFRAEVRKQLAALKTQLADDPFCLGVFSDNELNWPAATAAAISEDYYRIISQEMKSILPGVLYLGSRIHVAPEAVWRAAGKYCDVVSHNRYDYQIAEMGLPAEVDKPVMLTEFHYGALDRGLPHPGLRAVFNQRQRASIYADMVSQCLLHPKLVGAHWFQYGDQVYTGRNDGENYQIGFVDICDKPYGEMVSTSRLLGSQLYSARTSGQRPSPGTWVASNRKVGVSSLPGVEFDALGRQADPAARRRVSPGSLRTGITPRFGLK